MILFDIAKILCIVYNSIMEDKRLKIYLDNCCYNRPFDEVRNTEIDMEIIVKHVACAVYAKCDVFITTDKGILKKKIDDIKILNPIDFMREVINNDD